MMRNCLMPVCLILAVIFFPVSVLAAEENAYLDDSIKIMLRSGQGVDFRILAMLPLGQKVTVLGSEGDWVKIRTAAGSEGWVLKRFIGYEVPYRIRYDSLQKQFAETSNRLSMIEQKSSLLVQENRELKERLETEVGTITSQLEKFTRENMILRDAAANRYIKWALVGAALLSFGFLIGYLVKRERRQSYFL